MKLILYKIVMPFTVEDYEKGFLYTLAYMSRKETGKGSGVEVLKSRIDSNYTLPDGTQAQRCHFTHKIYHCERFVANWVRKLAYKMYGKNSLKFLEDSWSAFPYMSTTSWNMEKPDKINMTVESMHIDNDNGRSEKPKYIWTSKLLKNKDSFKGVTIRLLDVTENIRAKGMKNLDVTKYRSLQSGIGPLPPSDKKNAWHDKFDKPFMCIYKLARIKYDIIFGGTLESRFAKQQEFMLHKIHRHIIMLMDEWWNMSLQEIEKFEREVNEELGINLNRDDIELEDGIYGYDEDMETPTTTPAVTNATVAEPDIHNFIHTPPVAVKLIGEEKRESGKTGEERTLQSEKFSNQTGNREALPSSTKNSKEVRVHRKRSVSSRKSSGVLETPSSSRRTSKESKKEVETKRLSVPKTRTKKPTPTKPTSNTTRASDRNFLVEIMSQDTIQFHTPEPSPVGEGGGISVNDLDSFMTPNESMPDKCKECNARHTKDDPHVVLQV